MVDSPKRLLGLIILIVNKKGLFSNAIEIRRFFGTYCHWLVNWGSINRLIFLGMATTFVVARVRDRPRGPPNSWVPLRFSISLIPPSSENEPPASKGEGRLQLHSRLGESRGWDLGPHPSREGRGTAPGFECGLRANQGGDDEDGGGMGENERTSTGRDVVDV